MMRNIAIVISQVANIALISVLFSCGQEQFATKNVASSFSGRPRVTSSSRGCSSFTLAKPKVDILYLWDNSTSSYFINDTTKRALRTSVKQISESFDTHILLAPLIHTNNSELKFISSDSTNPSGITKIKLEEAAGNLNFTYARGSSENGVQRAFDLVNNNRSNGIFRSNSYLVIVLMSNGDDNSWKGGYRTASRRKRTKYINDMTNKLICLRGYTNRTCSISSLDSSMMKFISIVPHSNCRDGFRTDNVYRDVSKAIYNESFSGSGDVPTRITDQRGKTYPDSYNICNISRANVFNGVNSSIRATMNKHKYNYWPVTKSRPNLTFSDSDAIKVSIDGRALTRRTIDCASSDPADSAYANGFSFCDHEYSAQNTRYEPSAGEPFTGWMIKLYGSSRLVYPKCIKITTKTPQEFFGYIPIKVKPIEKSIKVYINGTEISKSYTNGWQLVKDADSNPLYITDKNIRVESRSPEIKASPRFTDEYVEITPGYEASGYFIQLFGSAIYSNGDSIEVSYDPKG